MKAIYIFLLVIFAFGYPFSIEAQAQSVRVKAHQKISDTQGNFTGEIRSFDLFGTKVVNLGDMNGDGITDLGIGTHDDDGGYDRGALWILFMKADGTVLSQQKISDTEGGFTGELDDQDVFGGGGITSLGDLDGDGMTDLAVGAPGDDDGGGINHGAIWILFLNRDGTVKSHQKISDTSGNLNVDLQDFDILMNPTNIGDLNGDGVVDLATGSWRKNKLWILFLNRDGTVKAHQVIGAGEGGFTGTLKQDDGFGHDVTYIGDVNMDGNADIIVGALGDTDGATPGLARGAAWIIFLNKNGTVKGQQKISQTEGGFNDVLVDGQAFGTSVTGLGDLNADGIPDVAVGARNRVTDFHPNTGDAWILFLNKDGTVKASQKIREGVGGFTGDLDSGDDFGSGIAGIGDLNRDGVPDLAVAALADDDGGTNRGAVWIMFLDVPAVHDFTLIDASTDQPVAGYDPIPEGAILNLKKLPRSMNIKANTSGPVESVRFSFAGDNNFRTENVAPYALFGDTNGDYLEGRLRLGPQKIIAFPFTEDHALGESGNRARLSFTVVRDQTGMAVTGFVLVDVDTGSDIRRLEDGETIDLNALPPHLTIRAEVAGPVESVRFMLEPRFYRRVDNEIPYTLWDDATSRFASGRLRLTAYPFSKARGQGDVGSPLSITMNIENGAAASMHQRMNRPDDASLTLQGTPEAFGLDASYPNPFNPVTTIQFAVPVQAQVKLTVYDMLGREVELLIDGVVAAGIHEVDFKADQLPSGTYLYRLDTPEGSFSRTMLLLK